MQPFRICVLEDNIVEADLVNNILSEYDQVEIFNSSAPFYASLSDTRPLILISETQLGNESGYQICQGIKQDFSQIDSYVLFLSSKHSLEEQLRGMEVGADDYILKPYDIEQFLKKVQVGVRRIEQQRQLKTQLDYASSTAFEAMTAQSEMGTVLQAVRAFSEADNYAAVSRAVFDCMQALDLIATLYVEQHDQARFETTANRQSSEIERKIIATVRPTHRIWEKGNRVIYNFSRSSLLILNAPTDTNKAGRFRDILCLLMEAFDARIKALNDNQKLMDAEHWQASVGTITKVLGKASTDLQSNIASGESLFSRLLADLDEMLPGMGLEEDQEKRILEAVDNARDDFNRQLRVSEGTKAVFDDVLNKLKEMQK